MNNNRLREIPEYLGQLKYLTHLDLSNNLISEVPIALSGNH